jgi:mono/diheme cytochrome c family protein
MLLCGAGCQQQMAQQPAYRPLEPSTFFADHRSARPLVPGVVARGYLNEHRGFSTGRKNDAREAAASAGLVGVATQGPTTLAMLLGPSLAPAALDAYLSQPPLAVTEAVVRRGQERFTIFCVVCHDPTGGGRGTIVERGYTRPPSYITDDSRGFARRGIRVKLRDVPIGYFFEVMSKGYGAMPDYASQVPPRDRWAIALYIRALQLSQHAPLDRLPADVRQAARQALEEAP